MTKTEYVLVPREPLPEMLAAWCRCKNGHHFHDEPAPTDTSDYAAYRAMIAAAPEPQPEVAHAPKPANFAGWKDQLARLEAIIHELAGEVAAGGPEDRAWAIINEMQEGFDDVVETEAILAAPAQPELAAEPVAWLLEAPGSQSICTAEASIAKYAPVQGWTVTPLGPLTTPPVVEEAVKAEREACAVIADKWKQPTTPMTDRAEPYRTFQVADEIAGAIRARSAIP